ncbi:hypothetical protein GGS23DRAFT_595574 [Durotheca rogersii]|uniref:uncharacterized protein n=1 Tax=Durotheca rogersii TaxID=419775 RepID=UPI00221E38D9|nr:uncharacterized protein GGS23DRAFT_595574 [Durotheca rogersii]KAI5864881.1 hypothetical protein GGS23DRAFT_595574 [Durotheca rogersii]
MTARNGVLLHRTRSNYHLGGLSPRRVRTDEQEAGVREGEGGEDPGEAWRGAWEKEMTGSNASGRRGGHHENTGTGNQKGGKRGGLSRRVWDKVATV